MNKIPFTEEMVKQAVHCAKAIGLLNNSITSGRANVAGCLGEIALANFIGADRKSASRNFDLVLDGKTIEVKTKRRTVDPKDWYEVSVAETSRHQKPDLYAFISITFEKKIGGGVEASYRNPRTVWLCGYYDAVQYFEDAKKMPKGREDASNGFKTHVTMFNLPIKELDKTLGM